jgi:PAS domain S-box-containing protein
MCRISGCSRDELVGTAFQQYFTDAKRAADGVRQTLDKGAVTNYELTLRKKEGLELLVSFNAAIFKDDSGKVRGIFASARDITDQAKLQTQLAEERAYNRGLIEASVDGLVTVNEQMLITDVNKTMSQMAGKSRTQLIGSSFADYFLERERAAEGVRLTFKENSVTNYVLTLQASGGKQIPVFFNAAVFRDPNGNLRGIFASARDITAQKQLEGQLQASHFYTRSLIESNIDALMTTDSLGIITDVNQQMAALTGCTREELIGTPFKMHFTDPARAEEGIRLVLQKTKVTNYELTARSKKGKETVVSYNATTFNDQSGTLQGVFAAARDITEQKKLEQQLRDQQAYNRGLIESSVDGLITVDPAGTISDVNEQMCRMTGYGREELIGSPFAGYFTEPERATAGVKQTFETGVVTEYALTLISRTRRLLQVSFNASVFRDPLGHVKGIFASARDITDRVRLEERLREQQIYLRGLIESSVDGLITVDPTGFITDVNDQMCRMTGYSREELIGSIFKHYFTEPDRADLGVKRTLHGIHRCQLRVGTAVQSREQSHGFLQRLDLSHDPNGLVDAVIADLDQDTQGRNIDWKRTLLPVAVGDPTLLKQVFSNLISNALKYTRPRDLAEIEIAVLGETTEDITLLVRDNGVGFDQQQATKLFAVFRRLHSREEFEGTGVGLATVRCIVIRHGGRVWAEARPGEGATSYFTLPARNKNQILISSPNHPARLRDTDEDIFKDQYRSASRRESPRLPLKTPMRLRIGNSAAPEQRAMSENLSERDVFFATNPLMEIGSALEILLKMPQDLAGKPATEWRCSGHVVRVEPLDSVLGKFGVGVRFDRFEILGTQ